MLNADKMRHALAVQKSAIALKKQHDTYVLLKRENKEFVLAGDPVSYRTNEYHRTEIQIPEEARRYVFNLWKREIALKYNAAVRELNQLGMDHGLQSLPITRPFP